MSITFFMSELIMLSFILLLVLVSSKNCRWSTSWFSSEIMECSGVGNCNRETGVCECYDGFEGLICDKMSCPLHEGKECNGNGRCVDMSVLTSLGDKKYRGCICDIGYTGHACERSIFFNIL